MLGQVESGPGWIALEFTTRVSGNTESSFSACRYKDWSESRRNSSWKFLKCNRCMGNKHGTSIEFDAQKGIVRSMVVLSLVFNFLSFTSKKVIYMGLVACLAQQNKTPILFIPSREGGSESIYWR